MISAFNVIPNTLCFTSVTVPAIILATSKPPLDKETVTRDAFFMLWTLAILLIVFMGIIVITVIVRHFRRSLTTDSTRTKTPDAAHQSSSDQTQSAWEEAGKRLQVDEQFENPITKQQAEDRDNNDQPFKRGTLGPLNHEDFDLDNEHDEDEAFDDDDNQD